MIDGFWAALAALVGGFIGTILGFCLALTYLQLFMPGAGLEALDPIIAGLLIGGWMGIATGVWVILRGLQSEHADMVGGIVAVACFIGLVLMWQGSGLL